MQRKADERRNGGGWASPSVAAKSTALRVRMKSSTRPPKTASTKAKSAAKASASVAALTADPVSKPTEAASEKPPVTTEASTQVLALPRGLYLFSVVKAPEIPKQGADESGLPSIEIGPGPGVPADQVQLFASPNMKELRLRAVGDVIVSRVSKEGAAVLLTSMRPPDMAPLEIQIQRLDTRTVDRNPEAAPPKAVEKTGITGSAGGSKGANPAALAKISSISGDVRLQIVGHIQNRGDVPFIDTLWAGFLGSGLSIEALSVAAVGAFDGGKIEYKTLDATGGETPWATDAALCGSRGRGLPLTGFCVRVKPQGGGALYDCEYNGAFTSGQVVGPVRNGAPCRSTTPGDFLEAVQIKMLKRQPAKA
jgi:hypothetical protein